MTIDDPVRRATSGGPIPPETDRQYKSERATLGYVNKSLQDHPLAAKIISQLMSLLSSAKASPQEQAHFLLARLTEAAPNNLLNQARISEDLLNGIAEGILAWQKEQDAFKHPGAVRVQLEESLADVERTFSKDSFFGKGLETFIAKVDQFVALLQGLHVYLKEPSQKPALQGFADAASVIAGALHSLPADIGRTTINGVSESAAEASKIQRAGAPAPDKAMSMILEAHDSIELEPCMSSLQQTVLSFFPDASARDTARLKNAMHQLAEHARTAPAIPLLPGQRAGTLREIRPAAVYFFVNSILANIAKNLRQLTNVPLESPLSLSLPIANKLSNVLNYDFAQASPIPSLPQKLSAAPVESPFIENPVEEADADSYRKELDGIIATENDDAATNVAAAHEYMSVATPEQKAQLIEVLKEGTTTDEEDRAILSILQSCESPEEFHQVYDAIGGAGIMEEVDAEGVDEKILDLSNRWGPAELSEEEIENLRNRLNQIINDEDDGAAVEVSRDANFMSAATPEQKSRLIQILKEGYTSDEEDHAIFNILNSCEDRETFYAVFDGSGGTSTIDEVGAEGVADKIKGLAAKFGSPELSDEAINNLRMRLDQIISDKDDDAVVDVSRDPRVMAAATPEQKAQLIQILKAGHTNDAEDQAIADILASCRAKGEFEQVVGMAGGRESLVNEVDLGSARDLINRLAGRSDLLFERAISDEDEDAIKEMLKDPALMAKAKPEQKARMINVLKEGWTTDSDDRAILDILETCASRSEFDRVMEGCGGRDTFEEVESEDVIRKMNLLAGGYDRMDLATQPDVAQTMRGAFLGESDLAVMTNPAIYDPGVLDRGEGSVQGLTEYEIKQKAYYNIPPNALKELMMENAIRKAEGKPPLDLSELTSRMERIRTEKGMSDDMRKHEIEALRNEFGLSEDTMRELATERLGRIYSDAAKDTGITVQGQLRKLEEQYRQAVAKYGAESQEALKVKKELDEMRIASRQYVGNLSDVGEQLESLYPVPPSFWEEFVNFFVGIFDMLSPLLNWVPGVGNLLYTAYCAYKIGDAIADGDIGRFFEQFAGAAATNVFGVNPDGSWALGKNPFKNFLPDDQWAVWATYYRKEAVDDVKLMEDPDAAGMISLGAKAIGGVGGLVAGTTAGTVLDIINKAMGAGLQIYQGTDAAMRNDVFGAITGYGSLVYGGVDAGREYYKKISLLQAAAAKAAAKAAAGAAASVGAAAVVPPQFWVRASAAGDVAGALHDLSKYPDLQPRDMSQRVVTLLHQAGNFSLNRFSSCLQELPEGFGDAGVQQWLSELASDVSVHRVLAGARGAIVTLQNISTGNYDRTLRNLITGLGAVRSQSAGRALQDAMTCAQAANGFVKSLRSGRYARALNVVSEKVSPFFHQDFEKAAEFFLNMAGTVQAGIDQDLPALRQFLAEPADGAPPMLESLTSDEFTTILSNLSAAAKSILRDHEFRSAAQTLEDGASFVRSLLTAAPLHLFHELMNVPELRDLQPTIRESGAVFANLTLFVSDLASGSCWNSLNGLGTSQCPIMHNQGFVGLLHEARNATSFFSLLSSGLFTRGSGRNLVDGFKRIRDNGREVHDLRILGQRTRALLARYHGQNERFLDKLCQVAAFRHPEMMKMI